MTAHSSKGVRIELVREDVSAMIRRVAAHVEDMHAKALQKQREYESVHHYENGVETFVCLVKRASSDRASVLPKYTATTVTEIGTAGLVTTPPDEERFLESSMRMALIPAFVRGRVCQNLEEARARASKARFIFERSQAFGSAKGVSK